MKEPELTPRVVATVALMGVIAVAALSLVASAQVALVVLAVVVLGGGVARAITSKGAAFVVRRRVTDVTVLAVLGVALLYLAVTTPLN